jgi:predicted double-glycine peptidase
MIVPPMDIVIAVLVMLAVSSLLFILALRLGKRRPRIGYVMTAVGAALLLVHALWLNDNLIVTRVFRFADALVYANLALPGAALLAGGAWALLKSPRWQKIVCVVAVIGLGGWRLLNPLVGRAPTIGKDRWTEGVCRQSSTSSCSAAAAATLLANNGIPADEREMIDLCLTHENGTSMLGLYRGLRLKTKNHEGQLLAGHPSADELKHWPTPSIVSIALQGNGGWLQIGNRHSIAVLGFDGDHVEIADPFTGRQRWTTKHFADEYAGDAVAFLREDQKKTGSLK